ncbi:MAG TPA: class I SAM-dependent methyltransferase [Ktedonobacteraceae bacterium]|nr:class I SAM-dependent methyltransferase [Ktedonobacteraceae bacterium]
MKKTQASQTAKATAAVRAIESEKPANARICYDPFARRFIELWFYLLIKLFAGYGEQRSHGELTFIVCRCRYFDDYLQRCLQIGTAQVVILGAGLDSRAYLGELLQGTAKTFEVDHPATQAWKMKRVQKVFGTLPAHVSYVPIDFTEETLGKLLTSGFDPSLKTLFLWEGVTPYLNAKAVDATLAWVSTNAAKGSEIIFDYQTLAGRSLARRRRGLVGVVLSRISGERRDFGIEQSQIEDFLIQRGFTQIVSVNAEQLQCLYCRGPNQGRTVTENYAIVHGQVGESR